MQKVVLTSNGAQVNCFHVPEFTTAQNAVISHIASDRHNNRATITDEKTGDLRVYFVVNDRLNISVF